MDQKPSAPNTREMDQELKSLLGFAKQLPEANSNKITFIRNKGRKGFRIKVSDDFTSPSRKITRLGRQLSIGEHPHREGIFISLGEIGYKPRKSSQAFGLNIEQAKNIIERFVKEKRFFDLT